MTLLCSWVSRRLALANLYLLRMMSVRLYPLGNIRPSLLVTPIINTGPISLSTTLPELPA